MMLRNFSTEWPMAPIFPGGLGNEKMTRNTGRDRLEETAGNMQDGGLGVGGGTFIITAKHAEALGLLAWRDVGAGKNDEQEAKT